MEETQEQKVITVLESDYELLINAVKYYKEQAELKDMEIEEVKKQYEPQSLDLDLGGINLEQLREIVLPDAVEDTQEGEGYEPNPY